MVREGMKGRPPRKRKVSELFMLEEKLQNSCYVIDWSFMFLVSTYLQLQVEFVCSLVPCTICHSYHCVHSIWNYLIQGSQLASLPTKLNKHSSYFEEFQVVTEEMRWKFQTPHFIENVQNFCRLHIKFTILNKSSKTLAKYKETVLLIYHMLNSGPFKSCIKFHIIVFVSEQTRNWRYRYKVIINCESQSKFTLLGNCT